MNIVSGHILTINNVQIPWASGSEHRMNESEKCAQCQWHVFGWVCHGHENKKGNQFSIITHLSTDLNNFCYKMPGQSAYFCNLFLGNGCNYLKALDGIGCDALNRTDTHITQPMLNTHYAFMGIHLFESICIVVRVTCISNFSMEMKPIRGARYRPISKRNEGTDWRTKKKFNECRAQIFIERRHPIKIACRSPPSTYRATPSVLFLVHLLTRRRWFAILFAISKLLFSAPNYIVLAFLLKSSENRKERRK